MEFQTSLGCIRPSGLWWVWTPPSHLSSTSPEVASEAHRPPGLPPLDILYSVFCLKIRLESITQCYSISTTWPNPLHLLEGACSDSLSASLSQHRARSLLCVISYPRAEGALCPAWRHSLSPSAYSSPHPQPSQVSAQLGPQPRGCCPRHGCGSGQRLSANEKLTVSPDFDLVVISDICSILLRKWQFVPWLLPAFGSLTLSFCSVQWLAWVCS